MKEKRNRSIISSFIWIALALGGMLAIFAASVLLHDDVLMKSDSAILEFLDDNIVLLMLVCAVAYLGILAIASRMLNKSDGNSGDVSHNAVETRKFESTSNSHKKSIPWTALVVAIFIFLMIIGYFWLQGLSQLG